MPLTPYSRWSQILCRLLMGSALLGGTAFSSLVQAADGDRPNVLLVAVDDLNNQIGAFGHPEMHTPNMDRIAARGVSFTRHYTSMPICIPSRVALLTSLRSERTRQVYGPIRWQEVQGAKALGNTFKEHGYRTLSLGKIWHGNPKGPGIGDDFDVKWQPGLEHEFASEDFDGMKRSKETMLKLPATEGPIDVPDDAYMDGMIADRAVSELKKLATSDQPFMLAVGFNKPHLPLNAPAPYWSHYNPMSPPAQPQRTSPPDGMSPFAPRPFNEVESFGGALPRMPEGSSKDDHIRHAYAASTTYADAQIGKVLDTLEELGLSDNTIIVLWGDHGWHLGDLGMWAKHTNFEASARCPLIISAPGGQQGQQTDSLVETVDIFPTLLDLCGLPALPVSDGTSLRPVLEDPSRPWKQAAYHCVDRYIKPSPDQKAVLHLGRAVRTDRFRYVEWRNGWDAGSRLAGRELYDYADQDFETVNVADDPAYAEVVKRMSELLWAWDGQPGLDGDAEVPTPLAALEVVR